jgi:hypothetical protein
MLACARQKRERDRESLRVRGREGEKEGGSEPVWGPPKQRQLNINTGDTQREAQTDILIHSGTWIFFPVESTSTTLMKDCKFFSPLKSG